MRLHTLNVLQTAHLNGEKTHSALSVCRESSRFDTNRMSGLYYAVTDGTGFNPTGSVIYSYCPSATKCITIDREMIVGAIPLNRFSNPGFVIVTIDHRYDIKWYKVEVKDEEKDVIIIKQLTNLDTERSDISAMFGRFQNFNLGYLRSATWFKNQPTFHAYSVNGETDIGCSLGITLSIAIPAGVGVYSGFAVITSTAKMTISSNNFGTRLSDTSSIKTTYKTSLPEEGSYYTTAHWPRMASSLFSVRPAKRYGESSEDSLVVLNNSSLTDVNAFSEILNVPGGILTCEAFETNSETMTVVINGYHTEKLRRLANNDKTVTLGNPAKSLSIVFRRDTLGYARKVTALVRGKYVYIVVAGCNASRLIIVNANMDSEKRMAQVLSEQISNEIVANGVFEQGHQAAETCFYSVFSNGTAVTFNTGEYLRGKDREDFTFSTGQSSRDNSQRQIDI